MQATPAPMMPPPIAAPQRVGTNIAAAKPAAVISPAASSEKVVRLMSYATGTPG